MDGNNVGLELRASKNRFYLPGGQSERENDTHRT